MKVRNVQVLIKTEDKDLEERLKEMIIKIGAKVVETENLSKDEFKKIELLIIDTREMEYESMFEFISEIRKLNHKIKIMWLTCKDNIKSSLLAMKVGVTEEVFFPIDVKTLKNKIKVLLELSQREKREQTRAC
ncbi:MULTISPECIES: response regulator [Thermodesulfobacterium]|uniref:response regulator n=1 Tax=Thermodesulfobacterium TaxID=1740 RepID=UPI0003B74B33|nr:MULTISPECIES: response regulator [Thermodesulfobacterium]